MEEIIRIDKPLDRVLQPLDGTGEGGHLRSKVAEGLRVEDSAVHAATLYLKV
jgi:hypothetical protein